MQLNDWARFARMIMRGWDIQGRERFNFDSHKAHLGDLKNKRRRGGK